MVLAMLSVLSVCFGAVCVYAYRHTRKVELALSIISRKLESFHLEDAPVVLRPVSVLPTMSYDEMLDADYKAWYDEQERIRQVNPQSPHLDPDWDKLSLDAKPLVRGI